MNKIILDQTALAAFEKLDHSAELCDPSGRVLGYFTPAVDRSLYEGVDSPVSEEELDRRSREGGGRTLAQIMADLERRS